MNLNRQLSFLLFAMVSTVIFLLIIKSRWQSYLNTKTNLLTNKHNNIHLLLFIRRRCHSTLPLFAQYVKR